MRVRVVVTPKAAVLDPQGAAVRDAMQHLGLPEVRSVRIGKYLDIEIEGEAANMEARLHKIFDDLSNPVVEDTSFKSTNLDIHTTRCNPF